MFSALWSGALLIKPVGTRIKNYQLRICITPILIVILLGIHPCTAQSIDRLTGSMENMPDKFFSKIQKKYSSIEESLNRETTKYLQKLKRQEKKLRRKAGNADNSGHVQDNIDSAYAALMSRVSQKGKAAGKVNLHQYNSYMDTLSTSLDFLKKYKGLEDKVKLPTETLDKLKGRLNQTDKVKEFIAQRKQQMKEVLSKYTKIPSSLKKQYERVSKTAYYYSAQVKAYKEMLKDPEKLEEKTVALLNRLPVYQKFMKENSQLASLFRLPGNNSTGNMAQSLAGLQTRASVQGMIQQRIAAGGPDAMAQIKQNLAMAHAEIDKLKDKINKLGGGSSDVDLPDFKPNSQKTKSLLQRLEYGFDVQFGKNNSLMPSTSDLALSLGYKLNDKSVAGIGMSYKLGLGSLQHINLTSEGLGLRSYMDWKAPFGSSKWGMLGNIWLSAGYEMNYNAGFKNIEQLKDYNAWQRSALAGLTKKYKISKKVKGEMKLLYDFLHRDHVPVSQPVVFRLGYKF